MREASERAKIKPAISFHVLRHTHGSALAMKACRWASNDRKALGPPRPDYVAHTIRAHFPTLGIAGNNTVTTLKPKKRQNGVS